MTLGCAGVGIAARAHLNTMGAHAGVAVRMVLVVCVLRVE